MKHGLALVALIALAPALWGLDSQVVGKVQYTEGKVSYAREGGEAKELDLGFSVRDGDLLKTGADGRIVITLDKTTGMSGSVTVNPSTSLYLDLGLFRGSQRTSLDLLMGSVGAKVKKLAGSPTMQVQTSTTVAGVRGTEFEVAVSLNDAVLVTCSEGEVSWDDGQGSALPVAAGKAVEKRGAGKAAYLDADPAAIKEFRARWMEGELSALKINPRKAIAAYEARYAKLSDSFQKSAEPLVASPVLRKWMDEDRAGRKPRFLDPAVMREKKEIFASLKALRKDIFLFERVYVRVAELEDLLAGTPAEAFELRQGYTVGDFFKRFEREKAILSRRIGLFHYALKLYAQRDDGGSELLQGSFFAGSDF